ncbi:MAG: hypothetical protein JO112_17290 [Planctomycetes bacterium]|nr:hypothetical protein [Planctomycetota bacterium]
MLSVTCPECDKKLQVRDELAGKKVKCPGCGTVVGVPAPKVKAGGPATARSTGNGDDEEDQEPRGRSAAKAPARGQRPRKKDEDEDEDDRKAAPKKSSAPLVLGIVGGIILVCGGLLVGAYYAGKALFKKTGELANNVTSQVQAQVNNAVTNQAQEKVLGKWINTDFGTLTYEFNRDGTFTLSAPGAPTRSGTYKVLDDHTMEMDGPGGKGTMDMTINGDEMTLTTAIDKSKVQQTGTPGVKVDIPNSITLHFKRPGAATSGGSGTPSTTGSSTTPPPLTGVALQIIGKWYSPDVSGGAVLEFKSDGTYTAKGSGPFPTDGKFKSSGDNSINFTGPIFGDMQVTLSGDDLTLTQTFPPRTIHAHRGGMPTTPSGMSPTQLRQALSGKWHIRDFGPPQGTDVLFGVNTYSLQGTSNSEGQYQINDDGTIKLSPPLGNGFDKVDVAINGSEMVLTAESNKTTYHLTRGWTSTTMAQAPPLKNPPPRSNNSNQEEEAQKKLESAKHLHEEFLRKLQDVQRIRGELSRERRPNLSRLSQAQTTAIDVMTRARQAYSQVIQKYPGTQAAAEAQVGIQQLQAAMQ